MKDHIQFLLKICTLPKRSIKLLKLMLIDVVGGAITPLHCPLGSSCHTAPKLHNS